MQNGPGEPGPFRQASALAILIATASLLVLVLTTLVLVLVVLVLLALLTLLLSALPATNVRFASGAAIRPRSALRQKRSFAPDAGVIPVRQLSGSPAPDAFRFSSPTHYARPGKAH